MSLPATEFWFSLSVRRNRKSFMLVTLLFLLIIVLSLGFVSFYGLSFDTHWILFAIFLVPFTIAQHIVTAQRLRDMNVTGWLTFLWMPIQMLPDIYSILFWIAFFTILCFVPGTKGPNNYGDDPLETEYES